MPNENTQHPRKSVPARALRLLQRVISWQLPSLQILPTPSTPKVPDCSAMEADEWTKVYSPEEAAELRKAVSDIINA